jgi:hypothetical protein
MEQNKKPFEWFELTSLRQSPNYLSKLASQLNYDHSAKLAEFLNGCTEILLAQRIDFKNYKNKRIHHIQEKDLNDLPTLAEDIKKLCDKYPVEWCVNRQETISDEPASRALKRSPAIFKRKLPNESDPSVQIVQQTINETRNGMPDYDLRDFDIKLGRFEIDLLDLFAIHIFNLIDEAFSKTEARRDYQLNEKSDPADIRIATKEWTRRLEVENCLLRASMCWNHLLRKKRILESLKEIEPILLKLDKSFNEFNQSSAGLITATKNRFKAFQDDIYIAFLILYWLSKDENKQKKWRSYHALAEDLADEVIKGVLLPLKSRIVELSEERIRIVIKEIHHFDNTLLAHHIKNNIPEIPNDKSRWKDYKIEKQWCESPPHYNLQLEVVVDPEIRKIVSPT